MGRNKKYIALVACLLLFILLSQNELFAQGCSQCKMVPESNLKAGGSVAKNLNTGILYLMAVPYIILLLLFRKQLISLYKSLVKKVN